MIKSYGEHLLINGFFTIFFICFFGSALFSESPDIDWKFIAFMVLLSILLVRNWIIFQGIKVKNDEVYLARFFKWEKLDPSMVSKLECNGGSIIIHGERLNIFHRVQVFVLFSKQNFLNLKYQLEKVFSSSSGVVSQ